MLLLAIKLLWELYKLVISIGKILFCKTVTLQGTRIVLSEKKISNETNFSVMYYRQQNRVQYLSCLVILKVPFA